MFLINVKNEGITGIEQVYECKNDDKQWTDFPLNTSVLCLMILNYNVHAESAEI